MCFLLCSPRSLWFRQKLVVDIYSVDCLIEKRLLGVITFSTTSIPDLKSASVLFVAGTLSPTRTSDTYYIELTAANGDTTKMMAGDRTADRSKPVVDGINAFLADPNRQDYSDWAMYTAGYLAIVPGLLALLFTSLVVWDMIATRWRVFKSS